ncbi:hypothetical protein [Haloarcula salina]|uniref:Uncharacterized protein n=1 Tax=Haloarcula salina TaxID=1429914 RepID=A0AA41G5D2_9EURY|nr:hypothetical protein [Haloarcula salina]MBV0903916.1 hypothetical protein [Haloarcula salina]
MSSLTVSLPSVTGYDYVSDTEPGAPDVGETWFDTSLSPPVGKVWGGSAWVEESAPAGGSGITLSGGQYDVATGDGLTISSGAVALLLSSDLTIDGNGDLALAFDPATQSELDTHAGDANAHHSKPSGTSSTVDRPTYTPLYSKGSGDGMVQTSDSGPFDAIRLENGNDSCTVDYYEGGTKFLTLNGQNSYYPLPQSRSIDEVYITTSGGSTKSYGITLGHSHSI